MSRDRSSHHFERFCATGEPAALAKVFDLSAPELMRVACYLSGDQHVAEDLVQAIFLTAIESRREFTASREVMPWLIGILINKVRTWRRSKQKSRNLHVDAAARLLSAEPGPADEAAADELRAEFTAALSKLDDPYRQVLEMHLVHDLTAKETAELLRRPAGTVRTQIVRGLEILRRTLPSSVITGAVVVAACTPARLAAMRELIVAKASAKLAVSAAGTTVGGSAIAGLVGATAMTKKTLILVAVLACCLFGTLYWPDTTQAESQAEENSREDLAADWNIELSRAAAAKTTQATDHERIAIRDERAALRLRVVWGESETPIVGTVVQLYDWRQANYDLRRRQGVTDSRGECSFTDLTPGNVSVRVEDKQIGLTLVAGETLRHTQQCTLWSMVHGRVLDASGEPVSAATVLILQGGGSASRSVQTDNFGHYRLKCSRHTWLFATKTGYAPSALFGTNADKGDDTELDLILPGVGRDLRGIIRDRSGRPIADAHIVVALRESFPTSQSPEGISKTGVRSMRVMSAADGSFQFAGLALGDLLVVAAKSGYGTFYGSTPSQHDDMPIVMNAGATLRGRVIGAANDPADVRVELIKAPGTPDCADKIFVDVARRTARAHEDGTFELRDLPAGELHFRARGHHAGSIEASLRLNAGGETIWNPTLRSSGLQISGVVKDANGHVHPRARITMRTLETLGVPLGRYVGHTDDEGRFRIGDLMKAEYELRIAVLCGGEKNRSWVETSIRMGGVRPGDDVQIRVTRETLPTCSIRGRVLDPDGSAPKHSMVWLRIPGEGHGLELEDGFFKTSEHLAPGTYFLTCQERNYPEWYLGEFTLAPNQSLDLGSLRRPQPGTLLVQMTAKQREYMVLHPNGEYSQAGVSNEELFLFPGRHFVQYGHAYFAVTIESGQQTTLDLRTLELAENRFELRASEPGRVLGGVDVVVRDSAGLLAARTQVASSNSRPNVVLALRHGHYRMHLRSETGLTAVHDFHAGESQALVRIEMFRR